MQLQIVVIRNYSLCFFKCQCHKISNRMKRGDGQTKRETAADQALPPSIKAVAPDFHWI